MNKNVNRVLAGLEPYKVFYYFEEICKIPHGSGNVQQISDYLVDFAKEHNLEYVQDKLYNIIIVKEASRGYESSEPIVIQGHMDMVAVKKPGSSINLETDGLELQIEGDYISAKDTTLGGDDGIAVAYALALLDSDELEHPRVEVVITVDEEVGMDGAREIDLSRLQGKKLLNIDSEEEGIFLTSCAGGGSVTCHVPIQRTLKKGHCCEIALTGLTGGHSGVEIHKERGNANCLLGRFLFELEKEIPFSIISLDGGLKDNAIPREAYSEIMLEEKDVLRVKEIGNIIENRFQNELEGKDTKVLIKIKELGEREVSCITEKESTKILDLLITLPNGVQARSGFIKDLIETSLNLGIIKVTDHELELHYSIRSAISTKREILIDQIAVLVKNSGGRIEIQGSYPAWEYRPDSPLRDKMVDLYKEMYQEEPKVEAIHAGLECGFFDEKIEDLDCVSFGPNMKDIHTTEECLSISSTKRVWEYLVELLKRLK